MFSLSEYVKDPCGTSSLPYWKATATTVPSDTLILHECEFSDTYLKEYVDEPYFRLRHKLQAVGESRLDGPLEERTATPADCAALASLINACYADITVTEEEVVSWTSTAVYHSDLWLLVIERKTGTLVGASIADYDPAPKELILEWVQVLPAWRRREIALYMVNALLARMKGVAAFATVSGRANSPSHPEALYRKCGFEGDDRWHVLRKK